MARPTLPIVAAPFRDVVELAMGNDFVCALDGSGHVSCSGATKNEGNPGPAPAGCSTTVCDKALPAQATTVVEIGAARDARLARLGDGSYRAWGLDQAQIGNGLYKAGDFAKSPEKVIGLPPP